MTIAFARRVGQVLRPLPQWTAVAAHDPQDMVSVVMTVDGETVDVTCNSTVAALVPLTIGIGAHGGLPPDLIRAPVLTFLDRHLGRRLGTLKLKNVRYGSAVPSVAFFEVQEGDHECLGRARRRWDAWLRQHRAVRKSDPAHISMSIDATNQIMIFYICPRPVVLVSVKDDENSNLFPMDLVGPITSGNRFSLALRSTNPSVETMRRSRRVALSTVAARDKHLAYQLGTHHKQSRIDLAALPFKVQSSSNFNLPVPEIALGVRELAIENHQVIGSHTFFVGEIISEQRFRNELELFHTSGFHESFQKRYGRPFLLA